jgi:HAD superfamily hydrolase (TIGR01509 family)
MQAAIFDIDGTLADTNYLHVTSWARALRRGGHDVPMWRIHRAIGMGSDQLLPALIGHDDEQLSAWHSEEYRSLHHEVRGLPGAGELLRAVKAAGLAVVLATSAKKQDLTVLLEAIGGDEPVDELVSSGDVESSKPAPDIFSAALERADVPAAEAVAVGDTRWDIEAAAGAGLACVGMLSGGWSAGELLGYGAVKVYEGPADLLAHLDASPLGIGPAAGGGSSAGAGIRPGS